MASPLVSQTVVLNDGSLATIHPVWNGSQLPLELVASLCVEYNAEIDRGRSFPETQRMMLETFEKSWFSGVAGVMIRGDDTSQTMLENFDLLDNNECLGSFWIQPCFPGRSSHICTANFLVKSRFRNHGVGKAMAQCFLRWALQLGYDYALFNLVYDCNIAACRILDKLGFSVMSVLKGAGILKGFNRPVDAFVFGRSLIKSSDARTPGSVAGSSPAMTPGATPGATPSMTPGMTPRRTPVLDSGGSAIAADRQTSRTALNTESMIPATASSRTHSKTSQVLSRPSQDLDGLTLTSTTNLTEIHVGKSPDLSIDPALGSPAPLAPPQTVLAREQQQQQGQLEQQRSQRIQSRFELTEEFEALRSYIVSGVYPPDTTRTERTRIRSRARSYEVKDGQLLFKRTHTPVVAKESDQLRIVTEMHRENHNGINKLQRRILEKYHWHGVRETIAKAIKQCAECKSGPAPLLPPLSPPSPPPHPPAAKAAKLSHNHLDSQHTMRAPSSFIGGGISDSQLQETLPQTDSQFYADGVDSPMLEAPYFDNVVYLPPENEDEEYVPEDWQDLRAIHTSKQEHLEDDEEEDDEYIPDEDYDLDAMLDIPSDDPAEEEDDDDTKSLFQDDDEDEEWRQGHDEDGEEDEDEEEEEEEAEEEYGGNDNDNDDMKTRR